MVGEDGVGEDLLKIKYQILTLMISKVRACRFLVYKEYTNLNV